MSFRGKLTVLLTSSVETSSSQGCPYTLTSNPKITNPKSASAKHPQNFRHLRDWFLAHLAHPFPSAAEKKALALEKSLTTNSVNLWCAELPSFLIGPRLRVLLPPFRSC
jgi:hypothetical protein